MDLSIVIVSWNTRELLAGCLESVYAAAGGLELEVFVVDNASTDDSSKLVREQFPQVRLIENQANVGFARANNQAIMLSQGRYVLALNSDTKVLTGALESLATFLDEHPCAGAAGARLLNGDGSVQPSCYPLLTPGLEFWRLMFMDSLIHRATYGADMWHTKSPRQVQVIKGACLLLRREALDEVGVFDETYFIYTEEVDLCCRLGQAGWECWLVPASRVIHYGEASTRQIAQDMYLQLYRSKIQFCRKFGGEASAAYFKRLLRLAYWPRFIFTAVGAPFIPSWSFRATTYRRFLSELANM